MKTRLLTIVVAAALATGVLLVVTVPSSAQVGPFASGSFPLPMAIPASAVNGAGTVTSPQMLAGSGTALLPAYSFTADPTLGMLNLGGNLAISVAGVARMEYLAGGIQLKSDGGLQWSSSTVNSASDVSLIRAAAAQLTLTSCLFSALGTPAAGTFTYCSDCLAASSPCTGASTGAWAFRQGSAWKCL